MKKKHLVWFRQDLRTVDNRALSAACEDPNAQVIGIYWLTPKQWDSHLTSLGARSFVVRQLKSLQSSLAAINIPLLIMRSEDFSTSVEQLLAFMQAHQIQGLFFNKQYEINEQIRDKRLKQQCEALDTPIQVHEYDDSVLIPPGDVLTQQGEMFKVFTPFRNAFLKNLNEHHLEVLSAPKERQGTSFELLDTWSDGVLDSERLISEYDSLVEESVLAALPPTGEKQAIEQLRQFCFERMSHYHLERDYPFADKTSKLSVYLVYGLLSPRQCIRRVLMHAPTALTEPKSGAFVWISELIWREFYRHLIVAFPFLVKHKAMIPWTENVRWRNDPEHLEAWKTGHTGYPIVDAAMRQLNQTGWMHNRLRMIVASFLVKDLLIDWRLGEAYFMSKLIDGDFAANNGGWQWAASTGCDAAPYFRIFNPTAQSEKFDAEGRFIRQFVSELVSLSAPTIHEPFSRGASFSLRYPKPIVEHKVARLKALEAYENAKSLSNSLDMENS